VVFREGKRYTALNAADEPILTEHFHRDVIEGHKPKSIAKQPTEHQMEKSSDNDSPPDPPQRKAKKSQDSASLETSLGDAWKPPAEGGHWSCAWNNTRRESAQLALDDEKFEDMIPI
jgi:hypothetical protein